MTVVALWVAVLATDGAGQWTAFRTAEVRRDTNMPPGLITNRTPVLVALSGSAESTWLTNGLPPERL